MKMWLFSALAALLLLSSSANGRELLQLEPALTAPGPARTVRTLVGEGKVISPDEAPEVRAALLLATPAAAAAAAPAAMAPMFQVLLDKHNAYRARHGANNLTWSDDLSAAAAAWAAKCRFVHEGNLKEQGENMYVTTSSNMAAAVSITSDSWYSEVTLYNFSAPGYQRGTGHLTQMLWKNTLTIGCAVKACANVPELEAAGSLVICRYSPPGNWIGEFQENVGIANGSGIVEPPIVFDPSQTLPAGSSILSTASQPCVYSKNALNAFCISPNGNVMLFQSVDEEMSDWKAAWTSRSGNKQGMTKPFRLSMNKNGNLVVTDKARKTVWASRTANKGTSPAMLVMQDDGNAVILDSASSVLWSSKTTRKKLL